MNAFRFVVSCVVMVALAACTTPPKNTASVAALAVLSSDAGLHEKARACQELAVVGGPESVPALARLLGHESLADYARSGLESIPDPSAGRALIQSIDTLSGRNLAGVVNSLGVRREVAAVPALQRLALDGSKGVADEALASLGRVATAEAAKTLQRVLRDGPSDLRLPAAHASLVAAEGLAQRGETGAARDLLGDTVRALPPGHVRNVAEGRLAALKAPSGR